MQTKRISTKEDNRTGIAIGMSDGLTVPFALVMGLTGLLADNFIIGATGIIATVAGAIVMGFSGYRSEKSEFTEQQAGKPLPVKHDESREFFANIGLSEEMQQRAVEEIEEDKNQWANFVGQFDLGTGDNNPGRAKKSGLNIGISYAVGGLIPVSPYLLTNHLTTAFTFSAIITVISLYIFGYFKSTVIGVSPWTGALRITIVGVLAAASAFAVGRLIQSS